MGSYVVAIVGATGAVGCKLIEILEERKFPVGKLRLFASHRSVGQIVKFKGEKIAVEEATPASFSGVHFAFFAAGTEVTKRLADGAKEAGAIVIDKSAAFREDRNVPLVIPEINPEDLLGHRGIVASPNCSTIQMLMVLHPLRAHNKLLSVLVDTYQAASGAGARAADELISQTEAKLLGKSVAPEVFQHQLAFNVIPRIGPMEPSGCSGEEMKMISETKKILQDEDLRMAATCVRVPVETSHSEAVHVEFEDSITASEAREILRRAPGVEVVDDPGQDLYPLPIEAEGQDAVFVGRIRENRAWKHGLSMWVTADNLRKGAATNAVQIAEALLSQPDLLPTGDQWRVPVAAAV